MSRRLALTVAFSLFTAAVPAAVLRVPSAYPTIQAALNLAAPGDVILVAPGSYPERLVWPNVDGIRLVSEQGHAVTAIDGRGGGRVITFDATLTRATVLEGFTITGGLLGGNLEDEGAGILIRGLTGPCSPTVRGNRIRGNRIVGSISTARGAGIFVGDWGADPLIENNLIQDNSIDGAMNVYGAGVAVIDSYTTAGPTAEIRGNIVRDNLCLGLWVAEGGGIYWSSDSAPGAVVVGNVLRGNECSAPFADGAGIFLNNFPSNPSKTWFVNNTVVRNRLSGTNLVGAGAFLEGNSQVTLAVYNNIVALNDGVGVHVGTYVTGALTVFTGYNALWQNTGGAYGGAALAGPGDLFVDPHFVSPQDFHLQVSSPCIDAGSTEPLPAVPPQDVDGDPRRLDGNLDGLAGNGATIDIGADEVARAQLTSVGVATIGAVVQLDVTGFAGSGHLLLLGLGTGDLFLEPFGSMLLAQPMLIGAGAVPATTSLPIPNVTSLRGLDVYFQALVIAAPAGAFTNRLDFIVH